MAINRNCSYTAAITLPHSPDYYSKIEVTFSQDQDIVIQKNVNELSLNESGVLVQLTQEETTLFAPSEKSPSGSRTGGKAFLQIRVYKSDYEVLGSPCWPLDVYDSLSEEVL